MTSANVTPQWMEARARAFDENKLPYAAEDFRLAAEALREAQERANHAERDKAALMDAGDLTNQSEQTVRDAIYRRNAVEAKRDRLAAELTAMKESADMYERHWTTVGEKYRQEQEKTDRLAEDNRRLRGALRFYADHVHWMEVSEDADVCLVLTAIGPSGNPNGWGEAEAALSRPNEEP